MDNVYYKSTKAEILKRLTYLNKGKYVVEKISKNVFMLSALISVISLLLIIMLRD